jgi:hypothetical protein
MVNPFAFKLQKTVVYRVTQANFSIHQACGSTQAKADQSVASCAKAEMGCPEAGIAISQAREVL